VSDEFLDAAAREQPGGMTAPESTLKTSPRAEGRQRHNCRADRDSFFVAVDLQHGALVI
jgi:hypothetical protein